MRSSDNDPRSESSAANAETDAVAAGASEPARARATDGVRFLDDVRVLEIASLSPTQFGMYFADLGAEVIKVEPTRGDTTRIMGTRPGFTDSGLHRRWNRGKHSLALDTRTAAGLEVIKKLIPTVDILVEGLRPGALAKMGLTWEVITALNPRIVMIALSGYGQTGPYRDLPSHGVGFDAIAGLAGVEEDERGRPRVPGRHVYHGAVIAPLIGVSSALAALAWSRREGKPVFLDVAQADAAAFANYEVEERAATARAIAAGGAPATGAGAAPGHAPTIQAYRTRDGKPLMLMALERKFFVRLAEATGRQDLLAHAGDGHLVRGSKAIDDALVEAIATKDLDAWMEILASADVPVVPVNESAQVADNPQMKARIEWLEADQSTVTMKFPVKSDPPMAAPRIAPWVGQDTAEILARVAVGPADQDKLVLDGVIRLTRPVQIVSAPNPKALESVPMKIFEAKPQGEAKGAVIVIQEAFGITDHIKSICHRLAAEGYLAVAPHLFHRTGDPVIAYDKMQEVMPHISKLNRAEIENDVKTTLGHLATQGFTGKKVAIIGFCMGGTIAFHAGVEWELGAAITFYGGGIAQGRFGLPAMAEAAPALKTPWLGEFGDRDQSIPTAEVNDLRKAAAKAGVDTEVDRYPEADHGFHCNDRSSYHEASSKVAWARAVQFLDEHVGG
jgi:crotonobetainyl-CoA:carnitine CoA-transferase CaiB-like acyl-CoA transferase/dienelactone hydrolase